MDMTTIQREATDSQVSSARFIDRDALKARIAGRRVVVVGSGPSCARHPDGFIDSHDVVIRVNNYRLVGGTGRRTDVHYSFFGKSIRKTRAELEADGVSLLWCKCPDALLLDSAWHKRHRKERGVDFRIIYRERAEFWFGDVYIPTLAEFLAQFDALGRHVPTTGFSALWDVLHCKPASLLATGFDFFSSRLHNVSERWRPGNPLDPIKHEPRREATIIARQIDVGRMTIDDAGREAIRKLVGDAASRNLPRLNRARFIPRRA
jgi:hypothetical protein